MSLCTLIASSETREERTLSSPSPGNEVETDVRNRLNVPRPVGKAYPAKFASHTVFSSTYSTVWDGHSWWSSRRLESGRLRVGSDQQHGLSGAVADPSGDAAEQQAFHATSPVRAHDDQVGLMIAGGTGDDLTDRCASDVFQGRLNFDPV